jgi:hypothetical protein
VRRPIAGLALVLFLVASAAPALVACRIRAAQGECCCEAAPANSLCEPDCCQHVKAARPTADLAPHTRTFQLLADPPIVLALAWSASVSAAPLVAEARAGLHQRAAPRLPLRI